MAHRIPNPQTPNSPDEAPSTPVKRLRRAPKASDPAPVLKPSRAEEQQPTVYQLLNKELGNMPYGSLCNFRFLKEEDTGEKALAVLYTNLEKLRGVLQGIASDYRTMENDLAEHQTIMEGLQILAKKIGLKVGP